MYPLTETYYLEHIIHVVSMSFSGYRGVLEQEQCVVLLITKIIKNLVLHMLKCSSSQNVLKSK